MTISFEEVEAVAVLSNVEIEAMPAEDLVELVRRADLPHLGPDVTDRLPYYDRSTLMRLAYLARECSRNRGGRRD